MRDVVEILHNTDDIIEPVTLEYRFLVGYKGGGAGKSFPPAGRGLGFGLVATALPCLRTWAWFSLSGSQQSICLKASPESQQFSPCM